MVIGSGLVPDQRL
jgi:hypothetical protein